MSTIQLIDYESSTHCRTACLACRDAFPPINRLLEGGRIYGLRSDIRGGAWALSWALGGRSKQSSGEVLLDGVPVSNKDLSARSCFIGEPYFPSINSCLFPGTVRSCLLKALKTGRTGLPLDELTEKFCLTPERFDRSPTRVQHPQSWYLSAAVGFAAGKEVFCFPYLPDDTLRTVERMHEFGVLDFLRRNEKIVLLPSVHRERLASVCDEVIDITDPTSTKL